jgi:tetratricopeptide (TPR) repeat protein
MGKSMGDVSQRVLIGLWCVWILCTVALGQELLYSWQTEVRKLAETGNWDEALRIVDREIGRAPQDMDIRAWHARVLMWSGRLAESEVEYREIASVSPDDPDHWLGLARVYDREGKPEQALEALGRALKLAPGRADLHVARGRLLRVAGDQAGARLEYQKALLLEPSEEARTGLLSLKSEPKHELRVGANADFFSFASANEDEGVSLASQWTPRWRTTVAAGQYRRAGLDAQKLSTSVTGRLSRWGAMTVGLATAHDNGVIPKREAFYDYDHGWRVDHSGWLRGLEISGAQHWYWYTTTRILTVSGTTIFYLPHESMWSLSLIGAQSRFSETEAEWRPSGITRISFPIAGNGPCQLGGSLSYAVGTENFGTVDQIGRFSSQTYGGGLRLRFTSRQDVAGVATYQKRTQDRSQTSFGFTYGIRF